MIKINFPPDEKVLSLPINYEEANWQVRRQAREQYEVEQNGLCMHCKVSLDAEPPESITDKVIDWSVFPLHFLKHPIHLQHKHDTGMTEGAVHAYCNAVMWQYHGR